MAYEYSICIDSFCVVCFRISRDLRHGKIVFTGYYTNVFYLFLKKIITILENIYKFYNTDKINAIIIDLYLLFVLYRP